MANKRRFFVGSPQKAKGMANISDDETIDLEFLYLVKNREYKKALSIINDVKDINAVDPEIKATALHISSARCAKSFIMRLSERKDLDYLKRDGNDKYASELAFEIGGEEDLGIFLLQKENDQAKLQGKTIWPKPSLD